MAFGSRERNATVQYEQHKSSCLFSLLAHTVEVFLQLFSIEHSASFSGLFKQGVCIYIKWKNLLAILVKQLCFGAGTMPVTHLLFNSKNWRQGQIFF